MCVKSFKLVENGVFQEEGQNWSHYTYKVNQKLLNFENGI